MVIASIHQPSTSTFQLFDKLLLLSAGHTHYFGPVAEVSTYYEALGAPIPIHTNPAEFVLELMNTDFAAHDAEAHERLRQLQLAWRKSSKFNKLEADIEDTLRVAERMPEPKSSKRSFLIILTTLVHRSFIKSYRDVVVSTIQTMLLTSLLTAPLFGAV